MDGVKEKKQSFEISVILIDHSEVIFRVNKHDRGQVLLDAVFANVHCKEPKYYGLQFQRDVPDSMKWLDPSKSIRKQFKRGYPLLLYYRIKYYIYDMNHIKYASTRYQLFLQVKMEIQEQRLRCPFLTAAMLTSYAVQSELGDYHPVEHHGRYLRSLSFLPYKTKDFVNKVEELHKLHQGLDPVQAELLFLQEARKLSTYGVEMHYGKAQMGQDVELGVSTEGIGLFRKDELYSKYDWTKIIKISFKRKQFFVQLKRDNVKEEPFTLEFTMDNYRACKRLWKNCVDCHCFYRHANEKCAGPNKTQRNGSAKTDKLIFGLFAIGNKNKVRYDHADKEMLGFRNPQKSASSKVLNSSNCLYPKEASFADDFRECRRLSAPPSVTLSAIQDGADNSFAVCRQNVSFVGFTLQKTEEPVEDLLEKYYDSPFTNREDEVKNEDISQQYVLPDDLMLVRLKPDKEGRFGFNIKGGADLKMPITISKLAPTSPAGVCVPKLNIGDEIIQINGRDANSLTHEQAVNFIRSTREKYFGELVMLLRQNSEYEVECDDASCPPRVEQLMTSSPTLPEEDLCDLESSMVRLKTMLDRHEGVLLFNTLHRRRPDLSMSHAKLPDNIHKNRYRDISPYDETRVMLNGRDTDYINANHIFMEISGTNMTNHYIASQGPLKDTCGDFWAMTWEQNSTIIVMVTTTTERGLIKCHQYWPEVGNNIQFAGLKVETLSECSGNSLVVREILLSDVETSDCERPSRKILHFQYIAWPDHGVPDDSSDFLDFVRRIRRQMAETAAPTVIHCSAGIGRTGVFIAIETAMCLIEAGQPVCPLQITKRLRDQRAMMIQTAVQYRFVCEAVYHVYVDGLQLTASMEPDVAD